MNNPAKPTKPSEIPTRTIERPAASCHDQSICTLTYISPEPPHQLVTAHLNRDATLFALSHINLPGTADAEDTSATVTFKFDAYPNAGDMGNVVVGRSKSVAHPSSVMRRFYASYSKDPSMASGVSPKPCGAGHLAPRYTQSSGQCITCGMLKQFAKRAVEDDVQAKVRNRKPYSSNAVFYAAMYRALHDDLPHELWRRFSQADCPADMTVLTHPLSLYRCLENLKVGRREHTLQGLCMPSIGDPRGTRPLPRVSFAPDSPDAMARAEAVFFEFMYVLELIDHQSGQPVPLTMPLYEHLWGAYQHQLAAEPLIDLTGTQGMKAALRQGQGQGGTIE